jgi:aspartate/methionine/tyrosine aminotransferase
MTFNRDVLALVLAPHLMQRKDTFAPDVIERAKHYLSAIPNPGAYSESQGISTVRREVADFLERRDGYAANPNTIFLTNGASEAVRFVMNVRAISCWVWRHFSNKTCSTRIVN